MPAPPKSKRPPASRCGYEDVDTGKVCGSYRCKTLNDDPAKLVTTTERCYWHQPHRIETAQRVADVVPLAARQRQAEAAHEYGRMTREELMELHEKIARGQITETRSTAAGESYEYCAIKDRQTSLDRIAKLHQWYEAAEDPKDQTRTRIIIPDNGRGVADHPAMRRANDD